MLQRKDVYSERQDKAGKARHQCRTYLKQYVPRILLPTLVKVQTHLIRDIRNTTWFTIICRTQLHTIFQDILQIILFSDIVDKGICTFSLDH